ncbi:hypothetical protein N2152v2_008540 [Parachlorella kessleri]
MTFCALVDELASSHSRYQLGALECAEAEVLNQSRLRHPHIVALHEVFLTDNFLVLVLDYAAGGDLQELASRGHGLQEHTARWLFQQVLFALDYCHRMGVASRDIKPENILLVDDLKSPRPLVKLADFGLSTQCRAEGHTRPVGTPGYMAPEIVLASLCGRSYDAKKVDVWSAGVLLYTLLTGSAPFQRPADAQLPREQRVKAVLQRILRLDYSLPNSVSASCRDLLLSLLEPDASRRPSIQQVMQHPWCCEGVEAGAILHCNDVFTASSMANPPSPQLLQEVLSILAEACMGPEPVVRDRLAKTRSVDTAASSEGSDSTADGAMASGSNSAASIACA